MAKKKYTLNLSYIEYHTLLELVQKEYFRIKNKRKIDNAEWWRNQRDAINSILSEFKKSAVIINDKETISKFNIKELHKIPIHNSKHTNL